MLMAQAGRQAGRELHRALEPVGLDPRQFVLLRRVAAAEGCTQQAVGGALQIPPSRMVALVDALEERGLIRRVPNPTDRRAHGLRLTPAGRRLLAKAGPLVEAFESIVAQPLNDKERAHLAALLQRIADSRHGAT
jgi:DNA-binding MarR family transcriptional regulator